MAARPLTAACLALLFGLPSLCQAQGPAGPTVLFIAGKPSHGWGAHEHNAGCLLMARLLEEAVPGMTCRVQKNGWPSDPALFEGIDAVVMFCDGGRGHMVNPHLEQVNALVKNGVGVACLHYGVEVPKGEAGNAMLDWTGGYFETHWSVNPHWTAKFESFPSHPITSGVQPFELNDEWYYHMRFRDGMEGVTPILSDLPPDSTLTRKDGPHSGNPHVRAAVARGEEQHLAWASERPDGRRGFGLTGLHYHRSLANDQFRKLVLNAVVWVAGGEVPENGVETRTPTEAELDANQDYPKPAGE